MLVFSATIFTSTVVMVLLLVSSVDSRPKRNLHKQAAEVIRQMHDEGSCRLPQRRAVPVKEEHSNAMRTFVPHCVLLHRCAADSGCCHTDLQTCQAKSTEKVTIVVMSYTLKGNIEAVPMQFTNHTECHCVDRDLPR